MTATASAPPSSDIVVDPETRPLLRRVLDRIFGYDFFISYAWSDGAAYAKALADRLGAEGFEVFLDRTRYASGDDWKKIGAWTLRRTGQLILVGSPAALRSAPVLREVEIFSKTGRRIVPIDFAGSLEWSAAGGPLADLLPAEILRIREPAGVLESGPSEECVATLRRTFELVRQSKKRMRVLAAVAAALLVLSIASTGFAAVAQWQRQKAERRFDLAIDIAGGVVDKSVALSDRYRVPKSATGELLDWAKGAFDRLSQEGLPDRLIYAQANILMVFSDHYGKVDRAEKQLSAAQQARDLLAPLVKADPENRTWRERFSMIYDRIGQANVALGNLPDALAAHREQLKQNEILLAGQPSDPARQRSIAVSQERIGMVLGLQGMRDDAVSAQEVALSITKRLAVAHPDDVELRRDLAVSHEKMGELFEVLDRGDDSLASQLAALRTRLDLAQTWPENTALQHELAASHNKVGQLLLARQELSDALKAHQASLDIVSKLVRSDPANAEWQYDLAAGQSGLADVLYAQKRPAEALAAYQQALTIGQRLVAANPEQAIYRFGLAACYEGIGDVQSDLGQLDEALVSYGKKLDIVAKLFADDPGNGEFQRDLLIANVKIGDTLRSKGADASTARQHYSVALNIAENMAASGRLNPQDAWMVKNLRTRVGN